MSAPPRNLVNLQSVGKSYGTRTVFESISLGVGAGDHIGIVGRNGEGKSTLLRMIAGLEEPDSGEIVRESGLQLALVGQGDDLDPARTVGEELVGARATHEWAGAAAFRSVLGGLLGGVDLARFPNGLDTPIAPLSGGERRRIALAKLLIDSPELLLLDEPTNHLDVDAITWLAGHLAARRGSMVVITHDRWFLDAACTQTWEIDAGRVHRCDGGYAAYVLARAERDRQASVADHRRGQLVRKELAWLRRGPPARTSKPKFRIGAANELIEGEPEARNTVELVRCATQRLGERVLDIEDATVAFGDRVLLDDVTWRLGPGDRVALVGANGSGKTTLMNLLAGEAEPDSGSVERGQTVRLALLSQDATEIPGNLRVLESLEEVRQSTVTSDGRSQTAGQLCERFGFRGGSQRTPVADLSGGERRRLQLMRLLIAEPNVLLLDEPTNDLDIDTLTALEDLLDGWPGTLVVVSHDRYFVERVCDNVRALDGSGGVRHLPGGIDQYLELRAAAGAEPAAAASTNESRVAEKSGGAARDARKLVAKLERSIAKRDETVAELERAMADAGTDHELLHELDTKLRTVRAERDRLEAEWVEAAEAVEG